MTINKEKTLASQVRDDFPILREFVNGKPLFTWTMRKRLKNPK